MGAQPKRGARGAKGTRRTARLMTGCLHMNAGIQVSDAGWPENHYRAHVVTIQCDECGKSERLTDRDAGAVLSLLEGGR